MSPLARILAGRKVAGRKVVIRYKIAHFGGQEGGKQKTPVLVTPPPCRAKEKSGLNAGCTHLGMEISPQRGRRPRTSSHWVFQYVLVICIAKVNVIYRHLPHTGGWLVLCVCMWVYMHVCRCICVCVCVYICVCISRTMDDSGVQ